MRAKSPWVKPFAFLALRSRATNSMYSGVLAEGIISFSRACNIPKRDIAYPVDSQR